MLEWYILPISVRLRASADNPSLGQSHPGALIMVQFYDWTPMPTHTRLLQDVTAKSVVMSNPVNDQVLIYTYESRKATTCEFLA